jgi:DNA polymerase
MTLTPKNCLDTHCHDCRLHETRTNVVWGDGNYKSKLIFVGRDPGREEDEQGIAFVGRAGQLLNKFLTMLRLTRDDVLILNLLKCRPPGNREPKLDEREACDKYLTRQFHLAPNKKVVVVLGGTAWLHLTGESLQVTKHHGKVKKIGPLKYIYTFHPSYISRNQSKELQIEFYQDLKMAVNLADIRRP